MKEEGPIRYFGYSKEEVEHALPVLSAYLHLGLTDPRRVSLTPSVEDLVEEATFTPFIEVGGLGWGWDVPRIRITFDPARIAKQAAALRSDKASTLL